MLDEKKLARQAWSEPDVMTTYVDFLLEHNVITADPCKDLEAWSEQDRRIHVFEGLERQARNHILKLLEIKSDIQKRPIWVPDYKLGLSGNWHDHCVCYIFLVKDFYRDQRIISPFGLPPQPMMLGRTKLNEGFKFLDAIFAQISDRTTYDQILDMIRDYKSKKTK